MSKTDEGVIKTGDYSNFNTAQKTVEDLNNNLETQKNNISSYKNDLEDANVFAGPIAEDCVSQINTLINQVNSTTTNFSTIKSYINTALNNYLNGNKNAVKYLSIKDGKIVESSTDSTIISSGSEFIR